LILGKADTVAPAVTYAPQTPLLQRGAVLGQLESSRHCAHRPFAQNGEVAGQVDASTHCAH
jgi:hypothetical protein